MLWRYLASYLALFAGLISHDLALYVFELAGITNISLPRYRLIDVLKVTLEFGLRYLFQSGFVGQCLLCAFSLCRMTLLTRRYSIDEVEVQGAFCIVIRVLEVLMDKLAV